MTPYRNPRCGITLVEILISILLLGVGMTSLMTLFPLGLLNVRQANRNSRSGLLVESATADLGTRNLLAKPSFLDNLATGPWYTTPIAVRAYDPWLQDTQSAGADPWVSPFGAYRGWGPPAALANGIGGNAIGLIPNSGLPVCYDPLWRSTTGVYQTKTAPEARFASGIGFVRADPNPGTGAAAGANPSAHGLQRITNFPAAMAGQVPDIFVSPEDVVLQSGKDTSAGDGVNSPIVPDLSSGSAMNEWKYTWMFTGQQAFYGTPQAFTGDIVVFEGRPLANDPVTPPITNASVTTAVAGETVVEAIFGYTANVTSPGGVVGYGLNAPRAVLLRWSDAVPDPEIKVGGWIADVTYERNASVENQRAKLDAAGAGGIYPYQRCYWYQIAKRNQPGVSSLTGYREMTVWTSTPLRAFTLLNASDGTPYHVNAALIMPSVVNVFPRTIYVR